MPEGSNEESEVVLLTTAQAANLLGCSPATVRRRVPPWTRTPGGHRRYAKNFVTGLVRNLKSTTPVTA